MSSTKNSPLPMSQIFGMYAPSVQKFLKSYTSMRVAMHKCSRFPFIIKAMVLPLYITYYMIFWKKTLKEAENLLSLSSVDTIRGFSSLAESSFIVKMRDRKYSKDLAVYKDIAIGTKSTPALLMSSKPLSECTDGVIIYLHGGGMIIGSPRVALPLTRTLTQETKLPVLSIAYPKAPESKYPIAIDDLYDILNNLTEQTGLNTTKLILAGDRVPDGLLVIYPPTIRDRVTKSQIQFEYDFMAPTAWRDVFGKAYVDEKENLSDMLLSPINAPDELLSKFPPTFIHVGSVDPLYSASVEFYEKLKPLSHNTVVLREYPGMCHGFVSLDNIPEVATVLKQIAKDVVEMLQ